MYPSSSRFKAESQNQFRVKMGNATLKPSYVGIWNKKYENKHITNEYNGRFRSYKAIRLSTVMPNVLQAV